MAYPLLIMKLLVPLVAVAFICFGTLFNVFYLVQILAGAGTLFAICWRAVILRRANIFNANKIPAQMQINLPVQATWLFINRLTLIAELTKK